MKHVNVQVHATVKFKLPKGDIDLDKYIDDHVMPLFVAGCFQDFRIFTVTVGGVNDYDVE